MKEMIKLIADKVKVNGPKYDGSYTITFDVGEYEQINVAKLMAVPQQTNLEIQIKPWEQKD